MKISTLTNDLILVQAIDKPYWKISGTGWLCYKDTKYGRWNVFSQSNDPKFTGKVVGLASDMNYQYIPDWDIDLNKTLIIEQ